MYTIIINACLEMKLKSNLSYEDQVILEDDVQVALMK